MLPALIGLGIAAVGTGYSIYAAETAPGPPKAPDLGSTSRAVSEAEAAALPVRRRLEAAAQQGGRTSLFVPEHVETRQMVQVPQGGKRLPKYTEVRFDPADFEPGGRFEGKDYKIVERRVRVPAGVQAVDFTGYGEADVQGAVARANAAQQLALRQKYDPAFIEEALKQQALADPEGTAARAKEWELIQAEAGRVPDRPVAALLDEQVGAQLAAGRNLDTVSGQLLGEAVGQAQATRGQTGASAAQFGQPLTEGFAGSAREQAAQAKAQQWLASGATPEDVEYRRQQQHMANLAAFMAGQTPQSQFAALSGAQAGPTPYTQGQALPTLGNTQAAAEQAALGGWQTRLGYEMNQANPWMAGLSMLLSGASTLGKSGWQPFANTNPAATTTRTSPLD